MSTQNPSPDDGKDDTGERIRDAAQQIWLAGLGAFSRVQQEGSKIFDTLVKDGENLQRKNRQTAEEAQTRMAGFASDVGARAAGEWSKFGNLFEEQVARALRRLGVPSTAEFDALRARVAQLEAQLTRREGESKAPPDDSGDSH